MLKIALITPINKKDYLVDTIIDGLFCLEKEGVLEFNVSSGNYPSKNEGLLNRALLRDDFICFAKKADIILLAWGKNGVDKDLANEVDCWGKTIFIDGSELGKNRRYDEGILRAVGSGNWPDNGCIDFEILKKCPIYFRREKPYIDGITPLPFGIESRYIHYGPEIIKDIDICCIFGQEDYPPLRKQVRLAVEDYCFKNNLICATKKTNTQEEFYDLLARTKIGISVGGGGFDTARFWEILGNNCSLITEKIDIFNSIDSELNFKRIKEFKDIEEFKKILQNIPELLIEDYQGPNFMGEYFKIIQSHSSKSRVQKILTLARDKKLIT